MATEAGTAYVAVKGDFSEFQSDAEAAGSQLADSFGSVGGDAGNSFASQASSKMSGIGDTMAGVLGANVVMKAGEGLTSYLTGAAKKAEDAEMANLRLTQVLKQVGGASDDQIESTKKFIGNLSSTAAVSGAELKNSFATLLRGTHDVTAAQNDLTLATDISAATGKSLTSVSMALARAHNGSTGALGRLGIATKDASGQALTLDQIMGNLHTTFDGTAKMVGETTAGEMKRAELSFGAVQKEVGTALLPAIGSIASTLTTYVLPVIKVFAQVFGELMNVLGPVVPLIMGIVVAIKAWSIAQGILNAVLDANPLILAAVAIAALVAGIIWAYQNVGWFRDAIDALGRTFKATFDFISAIVTGVFGWIRDNWPLLLAILTGPFGLAVDIVIKNWDSIKNALVGVFNWIRDNWPLLLAILTGPFGVAALLIIKNWDTIKDGATAVWRWITGKFDDIVTFVTGLPARIAGAARGMWDGITAAFKAAINTILRGWNGIEFKIPGFHIGPVGYDGFTLGVPDIPLLGKGAVVSDPMLAIVGEAGREIVAPEALLRQIVAQESGPTVVGTSVTINGNVYGVDDLDRYMADHDRKLAIQLAGGYR